MLMGSVLTKITYPIFLLCPYKAYEICFWLDLYTYLLLHWFCRTHLMKMRARWAERADLITITVARGSKCSCCNFLREIERENAPLNLECLCPSIWRERETGNSAKEAVCSKYRSTEIPLESKSTTTFWWIASPWDTQLRKCYPIPTAHLVPVMHLSITTTGHNGHLQQRRRSFLRGHRKSIVNFGRRVWLWLWL